MTLRNIRIVLVRPSHPGNIGAAARAMKTMGLSRLYLVQPRLFPHETATTFSSNAVEVLEHAVVCQTLEEAISDCVAVFGTSARKRSFQKPLFDVRQAAEKVLNEYTEQEVAIVFGCERCGLENDELLKCHFHVCIPSNPVYESLNLAAAVQVISYELRMAFLNKGLDSRLRGNDGEGRGNDGEGRLSTVDELEGLYQQIENTLIQVGFINPKHPRQAMKRVRRMTARAMLDKEDMDLLRGMWTVLEKEIR
ncbi:MAG: RNA methyltransferase [Pseudomonadota bacterium]